MRVLLVTSEEEGFKVLSENIYFHYNTFFSRLDFIVLQMFIYE